MAIGNTALVGVASRGIDANFTHSQTPPPPLSRVIQMFYLPVVSRGGVADVIKYTFTKIAPRVPER